MAQAVFVGSTSGACEKSYVSKRYVELPPIVTDCVAVPASEVVLVGASLAFAATILTVAESVALLLMHNLMDVTAQTPVDGVLKTNPKPILGAPEKICGDAALVPMLHEPPLIESTTTTAAAGGADASASSSAASSSRGGSGCGAATAIAAAAALAAALAASSALNVVGHGVHTLEPLQCSHGGVVCKKTCGESEKRILLSET